MQFNGLSVLILSILKNLPFFPQSPVLLPFSLPSFPPLSIVSIQHINFKRNKKKVRSAEKVIFCVLCSMGEEDQDVSLDNSLTRNLPLTLWMRRNFLLICSQSSRYAALGLQNICYKHCVSSYWLNVHTA